MEQLIPTRKIRNRLGLLIALVFASCPLQAAMLKGRLDGVSLSTGPTPQVVVSGWACKYNLSGSQPQGINEKVQIHIYAEDESSPDGTATSLIVAGETSPYLAVEPDVLTTECGFSGGAPIRFALEVPRTTEATFTGKQLRVYAVCSSGTSCPVLELRGKPHPTTNVVPPRSYLALDFSAVTNPAGWSSTTNYFTEWGCRAPAGGINTIRRLNIAPIGSHTSNTWKDSLHVDFTQPVGGNPVIYFSGGTHFAVPTWRLQQATFNNTTGNWSIAEFLSNYSVPSGVSSNDGTADDYVMNIYNRGGNDSDPASYEQDGWGPSANKPGTTSAIPGVATTAVGGAYPLVGTGPLGISAIRAIRGNSGDLNTRSCIHMNPSLFDYHGDQPRGLMACLWTGHEKALIPVDEGGHPWPTEGCALPGGEVAKSAHYVYRYDPEIGGDPDESGWQLDPEPLDFLGNCGQVGTVNHIQGSNEQFYVTRWEGRIDLLDLPTRNVTQGVLDCTATSGGAVVNFAEASGQPNQIYFIATEPGQYGPSNGLYDGMPNHDIYVGFRLP